MAVRKIAFGVESFFPEHSAGTEVYILDLSRYLMRNGWEVHVVIPAKTGLNDCWYEGIRVHTFRIPADPVATELNGLIPPRGIEGFMEVVRRINPDIVHFHTFGRAINGFHLEEVKAEGTITLFTSHLATFFCAKGDLRYHNKKNCLFPVNHLRCSTCLFVSRKQRFARILALLHTLAVTIPFSRFLLPPAAFRIIHRKREIERVKKNADVVFSLLPWMEKLYIANKIHHSVLVHQGLPEDFNIQVDLDARPGHEKLMIGFVGRMHPTKGFHQLKTAFEELSGERVLLSVFTQKESSDKKYLEKYREQCKKVTNITWYEDLSRDQFINRLKEVEILVIPSQVNETGPLSLLEARALKIPVVASNNLGIMDQVVHGRDGIIYDMESTRSLINQLKELVNDRTLIDQMKQQLPVPVKFNESAKIIENTYLTLISHGTDPDPG